MATLQREAPQHLPRLARCFQWAIIHNGVPADISRYQRLFGAPADDPQFARLEALALEFRGGQRDALEFWEKFEKSVADHPAAWPTGQADRVRALVWCHMGERTADIEAEEKSSRRKGPLSPSAEECFRRALKLAPDQREPYLALFLYYREKDKPEQAAEVGRQLLDRFPDHVQTLQALGGLYLDLGRFAEGLELLRRAMRGQSAGPRLAPPG